MRFIKDIFDGEFDITQGFGENPQIYSAFRLKGHNGIDFGLPVGIVLKAGVYGKVTMVADTGNKGYGKHVRVVTHQDGRFFELLWGHLSKISDIQIGYDVCPQTCVGLSGNTGFCLTGGHELSDIERRAGKGAHLHFQVRELNALDQVMYPGNGYKGAINPLPLFDV